jgi:hypothetical protein
VADGGLLRRLADWAVLMGLGAAASVYWDWGRHLAPDRLLGAKLTYLSVVMALGLFQYRLLFELIHGHIERLHNPTWVTFRQQVVREASGQRPEIRDDWRRQIRERDAYETLLKEETLVGIIPHNTAIISNILAVAVAMLLSVGCDLAQLVSDQRWRVAGALSAAMFLFSLVPLAECIPRYIGALHTEVRSYEAAFRGWPPEHLREPGENAPGENP